MTAVHPRIVAALRAQLRARDPDARRVGWKIARGIAEVRELIGDEPVIGTLTSATQLEPGAAYEGDGALIVDGEVRARAPAALDPAATTTAVTRMLDTVGERVAAEIDGLGRVGALIAS